MSHVHNMLVRESQRQKKNQQNMLVSEMVSCPRVGRMFTFFKSKVGQYMQTEGNILNVHQAASHGDPREVRIESTCTS